MAINLESALGLEQGQIADRRDKASGPVKTSCPRFARIKQALFDSPMHLCPERALLITEYFKGHDDPREPLPVRKAKALRHVLANKSALIFPDELIVGNVSGRRKAAIIQPELSGVYVSTDLLWIDRRKTTPFEISWPDRLRLLFKVLPYWSRRNLAVKAFGSDWRGLLRYVREQLKATAYLINEVAGIGHFLPNYEKMLKLGVSGYLELMSGREGDLYTAARIAGQGLIAFADKLAAEAEQQAAIEPDAQRAAELEEIARVCRKVPAEPAETFQEALQSLWLTHLAVCLESINSAVSFGRVDQYLYPYYRRDLEAGRIDPERARELLLCFAAKTTEHVFMISERTSQYHGGYLVVQAAMVGGQDRDGLDAVNDLTYIFLDVMEESRLRDPNFQARIHRNSPPAYVRRAVDVCRQGAGVPALFNDEAALATLTAQGYPLPEARDYGVVGCVELALPGRSFLSTDAALFNLPFCLELALNRGRTKSGRRVGAATPDPGSFVSIEQVAEAFREQVEFVVGRLVADLKIIEKGNRDYHPTPFSSMLVDGCLESGRDLTAGGAKYNGSGVQGVGLADVADSLAALREVVFERGRYTLPQVMAALRANFTGHDQLRAELLKAPKFGNDHSSPDGFALEAARIFASALAGHVNTRGGPYVAGFYSSTCHVAFGTRVGALPSGRWAGEPLAASLGSANGRDRLGPTALLNSVAKIDARLAPNGYALNLKFDPQVLAGDRGVDLLSALAEGFFASGGLEMQLNVVDPDTLEDARRHPGKHPGLVVRVAGYCAYFDDLPDGVKREIIARTRLQA
ncbi:MAG: pyruvate formate lyase family protein [Thermodesulfobacteriota bacterium]